MLASIASNRKDAKIQHDILCYCQNISFFKTSKSSDFSTQIIEFKNSAYVSNINCQKCAGAQ